MSSRRKRVLPPWLEGVAVKKKVPQNEANSSNTDCKSTNASSNQTPASGVQHSTAESCSLNVETQCKKPKGDDLDNNLSIEQLVAASYKEFLFQGSIVYSTDSGDCNIICEDIIESLKEETVYIGFDTEWPVTYEKGKQSKTALVQLCLDQNKCYLFHVSCMAKFPVMLRKLIEKESVKKVGLNVEYDIWKLGTDYDINAKTVVQNSTVELKTLANKRLKTAENWSLEGLARNVLRCRISKDPSIRKCDWREFPLPEAQQRYAATDAVVSLMIYNKLAG